MDHGDDSPGSNPGERAVSPVLGEALLIGVVVILVGVVAFIVFEVDIGGPEMPTATLEFTQTPRTATEYNVTLTHLSGENLPASETTVKITDYSGDNADSGNFTETMTAGDSQVITTNVEPNDVVRVVWSDPTSDVTKILGEYRVHE